MAEEGEDSGADQAGWVWAPSRRYGPFEFGAPVGQVPHLRSEVNRVDMGDGEVSTTNDTDFSGVRLSFWNDRLVGVGSEESFVLNETEFIGAHFNDVRESLGQEPTVANHDPVLMVSYDDLGLALFLDMEWIITSVYVSINPELLFPSS
jgi:hypothetical protein